MSLTSDEVKTTLHEVIDPEVGLNIMDMGLVYGVEISDSSIDVTMTLTTRGCPMESYMKDEITRVLEPLAGGREIQTEIVWEPAWSPELIKREAMDAL